MCDEAGGCCRGPTVGPEAGNFRGVCLRSAGGINNDGAAGTMQCELPADASEPGIPATDRFPTNHQGGRAAFLRTEIPDFKGQRTAHPEACLSPSKHSRYMQILLEARKWQ